MDRHSRRARPLVLLIAVLAACASHAAERAALPEWLAGHWRMESSGIVVEELWMAPAGDVMPGMARTVRPGKAAFIEYSRIESRPDGVYFVAQPGGAPPTDFALVKSGARTVVFENKAHDFPQRVTYALRADGALEASIWGQQDGDDRTEAWTYLRVDSASAR